MVYFGPSWPDFGPFRFANRTLAVPEINADEALRAAIALLTVVVGVGSFLFPIGFSLLTSGAFELQCRETGMSNQAKS